MYSILITYIRLGLVGRVLLGLLLAGLLLVGGEVLQLDDHVPGELGRLHDLVVLGHRRLLVVVKGLAPPRGLLVAVQLGLKVEATSSICQVRLQAKLSVDGIV